jgi:hypothetical protein
MRRLTTAWRWLIGAALAALIIVLHVLPSEAFGVELGPEVFDLAHGALFAVIAYGAIRYMERGNIDLPQLRVLDRKVPPTIIAAAALALFAFVAESSQVLSSRDASVGDLIRDFSGILSGTLLAIAIRQRPWRRIALSAASIAVLIAVMWRPGQLVLAQVVIRSQFPTLMTFESRLELPLARRMRASMRVIDAPPGWPRDGHVAEITPFNTSRIHGIAIPVMRTDWSGYEALVLEIASAGAPSMEITVGVQESGRGRADGRYFGRYRITQVPMSLRIPLAELRTSSSEQVPDTTQIESVMLFVDGEETSSFLVGDMRLE